MSSRECSTCSYTIKLNPFTGKRSGQQITPASWMTGCLDYEGMTRLISAAVQDMQPVCFLPYLDFEYAKFFRIFSRLTGRAQQVKEGPYWEPLHAAPSALNRYMYQNRTDRDQSLRLIVEGMYGHMIFQDASLATRTPEWVHSYNIYKPPQLVAPTASSPITQTPPQIDGAVAESSTDTSVDDAHKSPQKKGTLTRVGRGLKKGGNWTWGKAKKRGQILLGSYQKR